jgi:hypothetical protein
MRAGEEVLTGDKKAAPDNLPVGGEDARDGSLNPLRHCSCFSSGQLLAQRFYFSLRFQVNDILKLASVSVEAI